MKHERVVRMVLGFLAAVGVAVLAVSASGADVPPEKAAGAASEKWLALVDRGEYGESWRQGSTLFRQAISQAQWESAVRAAREPLGKLEARRLMSAAYRTTLPGAPDGHYVVLTYESSFEKKTSAVETVTPRKDDDGVWRVSGYFVR
jgi:hypothetical protein